MFEPVYYCFRCEKPHQAFYHVSHGIGYLYCLNRGLLASCTNTLEPQDTSIRQMTDEEWDRIMQPHFDKHKENNK